MVTTLSLIHPETALPLSTSVVCHVTCSNKVLPAPGKESQEKPTVLPGMVSQAAIMAHPVNAVNTDVPYVAPSSTMHKSVTSSSSLLIINTPFITNAWHSLLVDTPLYAQFSDVPAGICYNFDMGISTLPTHTYTPLNHNSALSYSNHIVSHINNELSSRRYSSPFSSSRLEALIGPFCTSPLGTVPKPGTLDGHCIIQDLSFPRDNPLCCSVNNFTNIDDFRCNWGMFNNVRTIVMNAPDGTEAATLSVNSAFRCCSIAPAQQPNLVVHWNGLFYIDHNAPFGTVSSGGIFGRVANAMTAILASKGFGPSENWVNDFVFFRFPTLHDPPSFSYSLSDIYDVAAYLGWP